MTKTEALKLALEAHQFMQKSIAGLNELTQIECEWLDEVETQIKEALAQPKQELSQYGSSELQTLIVNRAMEKEKNT